MIHSHLLGRRVRVLENPDDMVVDFYSCKNDSECAGEYATIHAVFVDNFNTLIFLLVLESSDRFYPMFCNNCTLVD